METVSTGNSSSGAVINAKGTRSKWQKGHGSGMVLSELAISFLLEQQIMNLTRLPLQISDTSLARKHLLNLSQFIPESSEGNF